MSSLPNEELTTASGTDGTAAAVTLEKVLAQALEKALTCHQGGDLCEAEQLYRAILQAQPAHPEANHCLGLLEVQRQRPALALPYFITALEARPELREYWLSYIDALLEADQLESAQQALALGRQHGLDGHAFDELARRLDDSRSDEPSPEAERPPKAPPGGGLPGRSPGARRGKPSAREESKLVELVNKGRYSEGEAGARKLTERFPRHGFGWKVLGAVLKAQGQDAKALAAMRQAAELLPRDEQVQSNLGLVLADVKKLPEAEACYRKALKLKPDFAEAHFNLGNILCAQGRQAEAEVSYRRAVGLKPNFALAHCNLGNTLMDRGLLAEAEPTYRRALALHPELVEAHNNLGDTLRQLGRLSEAENAFRSALTCRPDFAAAHYNLGSTLGDQGRLDEAEAAWRCALDCKADFPEALAALGAALREQDRLDEAVCALRDAVQYRPDFAEAHFHLGAALRDQGRLDEALAAWRRALECQPEFPEALAAMGSAFKELRQLPEGEDSLRRALQYKPDFAEAHYNLANNLREQGRLGEAEAGFRHALRLQPEMAMALLNLGVTLSDLGRPSEAEDSCRQALAIQPDYHLAHSNLLFWITHNQSIDAQDLFAEHLRFGERLESRMRPHRTPHGNPKDRNRSLQIGFVSGDLYNHSVANFLEPLLAELKKYRELSLHAYDNSPTEDHVTERLRSHFHYWHPVKGMRDEDLAEQIRTDAIDILIDLSGHTAHSRLLTFARKPAPVQASWMGYPGTTGLKAMDYYLADRFLLPAEVEAQFTEKIVRLPANAPFLPFDGAPPVVPLPALGKSHVTLGSFNRPAKINPSVVALWSQLLLALPNARMLLGAMPADGPPEELVKEFAHHGITGDRLDFHSRGDMHAYLELHQRVDICLDTFPYSGGTTTLHAAWMGVPTLTLAGLTMPGRSGAAFLQHVRLQALIARSPDDFVARGVACANNLPGLASLRAGLRDRVRQSAVGQPALIAAGLTRSLRIMWERWCDGLPAEAFEVHAGDLPPSTQPRRSTTTAQFPSYSVPPSPPPTP
jgi:protein O-GlcNAc transferase